MTQEVQVTLTLEVDVRQSRKDIRNYINDMITNNFNTTSLFTKSRFCINKFEIKEEAEIYGNEENITLDFLSWYNTSEYCSIKLKGAFKDVDFSDIDAIKKKRESLQLELFNYFKNEIFKKKKIKDRKSDYVCFDCGREFLTEQQKNGEGGAVTAHKGNCCLCNEEKSITHIRVFNWLNYPKK